MTAPGAWQHTTVLLTEAVQALVTQDDGIYVDGTFGREGALSRRNKELIMVGITCALRLQRGIRIHSDRALILGASPREVLEAMEVAAIPGGMPGLWMGVETLLEVLKAKGQELK